MAIGSKVGMRKWILSYRHRQIDSKHVIGTKCQKQHCHYKPDVSSSYKFQASVAISTLYLTEKSKLYWSSDCCYKKNNICYAVCSMQPMHYRSNSCSERYNSEKNGSVYTHNKKFLHRLVGSLNP